MLKSILTMALVVACAGTSAQLRIGLIATTSGPLGALGQDQNDGFMLALEQRKGRLGGLSVETFRVDDQLKPEVAVQAVQRLIEKDRVHAIVGVTASNVFGAVFPRIVEAGTPFVGTNGGPSPFAGESCSRLFVSTAFQNDGGHEAMGVYAQNRGFKRIAVVTPNYQAGKDAIAGFKRHFKGTVVNELLPGLGQGDFSAELAQLRIGQPDAVFAFMPGGLGVNFIRQYRQAGLLPALPLIVSYTVDELTLPALGDAAVGIVTTSHWTSAHDGASSRRFVGDFEARYKRLPSMFAAQGYDAAVLLERGIERSGANWQRGTELVAAMRADRFASIRGEISFAHNGFPIQDFAAWRVVRTESANRPGFQLEQVVLRAHRDPYAAKCPA